MTTNSPRDQEISPPQALRALERIFQSVSALCKSEQLTEEGAVQLLRKAFGEQNAIPPTSYADKIDAFIGAQVLSEWHQNPRFLGKNGTPEPLSITDGTFASLCETVPGTTDVQAVLDLFVRAGAVDLAGDSVLAKTRDLVMVGNNHPAAAKRATWLCSEYLSTVIHNLNKPPESPGRFERTAVSVRLEERHIPSLLAYLGVHGQSFLEDVDQWMSARQSREPSATVGVGLYLFVAENESDRS